MEHNERSQTPLSFGTAKGRGIGVLVRWASKGIFVSLLVSSLAGIPALARGASTFGQFSSPSGGIGCAYDVGYLRCDVRDGVRPLPPKPKNCDLDWGQGFELKPTGIASVVCAGDTALGSKTVVGYGTTWHRGAFACRSTTDGLRCTNASRHGFFISRGQAYRF
jgi:hypothetical protein